MCKLVSVSWDLPRWEDPFQHLYDPFLVEVCRALMGSQLDGRYKLFVRQVRNAEQNVDNLAGYKTLTRGLRFDTPQPLYVVLGYWDPKRGKRRVEVTK